MSKRKTPLYNQFYVDKGDGEPLIVLHGLFGNLSNWSTVIDHFSKSYRVIVPRLPLFDTTQHPHQLKKLSILLNEFLDWHQLADVTLIGNSTGGHLALLYALQQPDNVKKLILTGSSGLFVPALSHVHHDDFINEQNDYTIYNGEVVTKKSITKELFLPSAQQGSLMESIHRIKQPALLIWGLQDEITPPEVALHFHDLLPNSELKFIDHCGHVAMMEHPDLFNQHVEAFLNN